MLNDVQKYSIPAIVPHPGAFCNHPRRLPVRILRMRCAWLCGDACLRMPCGHVQVDSPAENRLDGLPGTSAPTSACAAVSSFDRLGEGRQDCTVFVGGDVPGAPPYCRGRRLRRPRSCVILRSVRRRIIKDSSLTLRMTRSARAAALHLRNVKTPHPSLLRRDTFPSRGRLLARAYGGPLV
jgi:hypothetical protein